MICAPVSLNNVVSPIFMFYFLPPLFGVAAVVNLVIAVLAFFLSTKFFNIKIPWIHKLRMLISLWLISLIANACGSLFLSSIGTLGLKIHLNLVDYYTIYATPMSALIFAAAVLFSGLILYAFAYFYLNAHLTKKQAARIAVFFAIIAAPYPFLIPTNWFY
ncbi:hypothetical protein ABWW58_07060 [Sporolactobacillus sp. STCC-11]|uniref:hypothetical protein n=1 Tax=Sporolactobacillus caesalpiniae TaxID=3230362 RepID=UPI0033937F98